MEKILFFKASTTTNGEYVEVPTIIRLALLFHMVSPTIESAPKNKQQEGKNEIKGMIWRISWSYQK